ncbi:hypothetical protein E4U56_003334 [Claviceps arundinis]|uniref:2EXR domain-containing protein n=1 Tax=Claviceps arundinis TaxID=1623583 RepID=A0A9P7SRW5_9HYPO|nr:hypothetical protein E4U56_003334 [Claviceps arundinis]
MYSDEPMSTDKTSNTGYDAKINARNHLCLIDDEAEVSGEESSSEYGFQDGDAAPGTFPQFMQLPPELRHQIWHFYCPDLSVKARVLPVLYWPGSEVPSYRCRQTNLYISAYHFLEDHTRNLRVTLSTHRESRSMAVCKYPDELVMDAAGTSIVRFRKETDVILLLGVSTHVAYSVPDFGRIIQNLAVETVADSEGHLEEEDWLLTALPALKGLFSNLRRLFSYQPAQRLLPGRGDWITHDCVHGYTGATKKYWGQEPFEPTNVLYCWPDLDTYPDLVRSLVPRICSLKRMDEAGVEFWPIVKLGPDISMKAYDMLSRKCWPSSAGDGSSEAIDHDEVMELLAS